MSPAGRQVKAESARVDAATCPSAASSAQTARSTAGTTAARAVLLTSATRGKTPALMTVAGATSLRASLITSAADALPDGPATAAASAPACADAHASRRTTPANWKPAALPSVTPHAVASVLGPLSNADTQHSRVSLARTATRTAMRAAVGGAQVVVSAAGAALAVLVHVRVLSATSWSPNVDWPSTRPQAIGRCFRLSGRTPMHRPHGR
jgi:hypothetical protein